MELEALRELGLTQNEVAIYVYLLQKGSQSEYDIGKGTSIYRVHVYDKLEQLISRGLVSYVLKGNKKIFRAADPEKLIHYVEEKKEKLLRREEKLRQILPELSHLQALPRDDTFVEVFQGPEGLKYFLKDVINVGTEVCVTGLDDSRYSEALPYFMPQYFRDLRLKKIKERVISVRRGGEAFSFGKKVASTTKYRFLETSDFNPTNTFVYGDRVVIVTWGTPVTAVMIKNSGVAKTYLEHFEQLWKIAVKK
ncbi:hypothetical protein HOC01_03230 [archaeon]|nr:hypothetical protein [archaeon]